MAFLLFDTRTSRVSGCLQVIMHCRVTFRLCVGSGGHLDANTGREYKVHSATSSCDTGFSINVNLGNCEQLHYDTFFGPIYVNLLHLIFLRASLATLAYFMHTLYTKPFSFKRVVCKLEQKILKKWETAVLLLLSSLSEIFGIFQRFYPCKQEYRVNSGFQLASSPFRI